MKRLIIFVLFLLPHIAFSQLNISITSNLVPLYPSDGDTLSGCREDSVIIFKATVTDGGSPVTNAEYYWDFDDGTTTFGTDKDSVTNQYTEGGGYRVKLKVIDASMQE
ncbi:MAG: PKD domain-containing protein, partial [Bacteroidales bacterium]|nr:PKD domain-containing protein [Bacteroidales bacterium]